VSFGWDAIAQVCSEMAKKDVAKAQIASRAMQGVNQAESEMASAIERSRRNLTAIETALAEGRQIYGSDSVSQFAASIDKAGVAARELNLAFLSAVMSQEEIKAAMSAE